MFGGEGRISEIEPIFISTAVTYTGNLVYLAYKTPLTHRGGSALLAAIRRLKIPFRSIHLRPQAIPRPSAAGGQTQLLRH